MEEADVTMEEPEQPPAAGLEGTLSQLQHVVWEGPDGGATTVDRDPVVASSATRAARHSSGVRSGSNSSPGYSAKRCE